MGAVYEVIDEKTAGSRALKVMLSNLIENEGLRARFALEARITGGIESDHIVRTFDAGVDEATGMPFLVMELLRGEDLGGLLKWRKLLPPLEVAIYLFQAARALDKTHAASIVHRDLKPDNLFLTFRDDGSPCVKILDFGIAKVTMAPDPSIKTRPMMGTPLYMSPEQVRNERTIGPAADIYALGHITYTLLTGESYWAEEAETIPSPFLLISEIMRGVSDPPSERAARRRSVNLPVAFDAWFKQATALAAENRFDRATEAIQVLADALSVPLPRAPQPSFEFSATSATGDNPSVHGERTTADLSLSSSMEALAERPGLNTPTVVTTHSRVREDVALGATNPYETGVVRSRLDPQTTGIVDGPASGPVSSTSPWRGTRELSQSLAATGETSRAPQSARERPSPLISTYDKVPPTVARERPAPSPTSPERSSQPTAFSRDRAAPPTTFTPRDRTAPETTFTPRDRAALPPTTVRSRDQLAPPALGRQPTPPPSVGRELTPPPASGRDRTSLSSGGREPAPPISSGRDKTATRPPISSFRDGGIVKKDPPATFRFQISADLPRSILRFKVWGFWTLEEAKAYWEEFQHRARPLVGRPWYVLADISEFPPQKPEVSELVGKTMSFSREHGMVRAANLVSSALSKMQITRLSADTGLPAFSFFSSEAEAIAYLLNG